MAVDGETMTPCGVKTTSVECHRDSGHPGMHWGLLPVSDDKFADVLWSDDWHVEVALPWVVEADLVREMPIFPVCMYSRGEDIADVDKWMNS